MVGKNFTDVKLSRKDRVTTITGARSVHARLPQHCKCVLDYGHLLHVVPWPTAATYKQVWDAYGTYTVQQYGGQSVVVCDGYGRSASTTAAEQQRRTT